MRHCCEFKAFDIWYLKDDEDYTNQILYIGDCPICNKKVVEISQKNKKTNTFINMKKIGDSALKFIETAVSNKITSYAAENAKRARRKPSGWKYGINKEKKLKDGTIQLEQYASDFQGNTELIKKV